MRKSKKQAFIIIGIGAILILILAIALFAPRVDYYIYKNSNAGIQLKYPSNWKMQEHLETGALVVFVSPLDNALDIYPDNANITIQDISKNPLNLEEYARLAVDQLIAVFGNEQIRDLETTPTRLAHLPARKIVYIAKTQEADLKIMHVLALDGMTAYQFTYSGLSATFDQYWPRVNTMLASLEIK